MNDTDPLVDSIDVSRRDVLKATGVTGIVGGLAGLGLSGTPQVDDEPAVGLDVRVKQESGKLVYWVPPGPRRLSEQVFGTPEHPKALVEPEINRADNPAVKRLLREVPILVGVPLDKRKTNEEGTKFTTTTFPTPFPDRGEVVTGSVDVTYRDRRPYDIPGKPTKTPDSADLTTTFTDPDDNTYELRLRTLFQPPIPSYETAGGVMTNAWHHGVTGTGSPLMPKVYTYGAFWGIGDVVVNGEVADRRKVMHFMTTQTVRTEEYRLATAPRLPLKPEETIAGQVHHTHGIVLPVTVTKKGVPKHEPVDTAYTLPNDQTQPFIHIMFEQDTIVEAPFKGWDYPTAETPTGTATPGGTPTGTATETPAGTETPTDTPAGTDTATATPAAEKPYDYKLGGRISGWRGIFPEAIADEVNPTLELTADQEYTVRWVNQDGAAHNFAILDSDGDVVVRTAIMSEEGATQTVTFTATSDMDQYYCQVHPTTMIGDLSITSG